MKMKREKEKRKFCNDKKEDIEDINQLEVLEELNRREEKVLEEEQEEEIKIQQNQRKKKKKNHFPLTSITNSSLPPSLPLSSSSSSQWNYEVDYNDHFETPQQAYVDILTLFKQVAEDSFKSINDLIIYDPYYCNGRMIPLLNQLGIKNIINQNRDFYQDIQNNNIPEYDILLTNPPYSGEHKQKLFNYLRTISKPYALLLPAYTATKAYWKDFVNDENNKRNNNQSNRLSSSSVLYILPPSSYEYSHPEGTGKDLPPFYSAWFVGGFSSLDRLRIKCSSPPRSSDFLPLPPSCSHRCMTVLTSVEALVARGYVTDSSKRPNPKQRKKLKQKENLLTTTTTTPPATTSITTSITNPPSQSNNNSNNNNNNNRNRNKKNSNKNKNSNINK